MNPTPTTLCLCMYDVHARAYPTYVQMSMLMFISPHEPSSCSHRRYKGGDILLFMIILPVPCCHLSSMPAASPHYPTLYPPFVLLVPPPPPLFHNCFFILLYHVCFGEESLLVVPFLWIFFKQMFFQRRTVGNSEVTASPPQRHHVLHMDVAF